MIKKKVPKYKTVRLQDLNCLMQVVDWKSLKPKDSKYLQICKPGNVRVLAKIHRRMMYAIDWSRVPRVKACAFATGKVIMGKAILLKKKTNQMNLKWFKVPGGRAAFPVTVNKKMGIRMERC